MPSFVPIRPGRLRYAVQEQHPFLPDLRKILGRCAGEAAASLPQERLSALNQELGELAPAVEALARLQARSGWFLGFCVWVELNERSPAKEVLARLQTPKVLREARHLHKVSDSVSPLIVTAQIAGELFASQRHTPQHKHMDIQHPHVWPQYL